MKSEYRMYSSLPDLKGNNAWAEVDLDALRANYRYLRDLTGCSEAGRRLIAVVKADAYGHGAPACIGALLEEGCNFFAVSCIEEAIAAREVCEIKRCEAEILILGYTPPEFAGMLDRNRLIQTLLSEEYAEELNACAAKEGVSVRAHAALDTGMNRIGFPAYGGEVSERTVQALLRVGKFRHIALEGLFTHYAKADEDDGAFTATERQAQRFREIGRALEEKGLANLFCHVCNSAAAILRPQDRMDGVRMGILLYGAGLSDQIALPLRPVLKLRTRISHVHRLLPGESVGYGGSFCAAEERTIATVPIGYADGLLRSYSGATVRVASSDGTHSVPIVGRICMDQCMLDVTGTAAKPGDLVTMFGNDPGELSAYARRAGTIDYECLCLISSRIRRVYPGDLDGQEA